MPARAIWKGVIEFEDVSVPVKLYSAVQDRSIHFRLLHATDHAPVQQRMIHPVTGETVAPGDIRKGYEVDKRVFVTLSADELEELEPKPSRTIEIVRFVEPTAIDAAWYAQPYRLGPDGDSPAYFALADALAHQKVEGIARWVMRKNAQLGALRIDGQHLILHRLRFADQVVAASALEVPAPRKTSDKELAMARQLVSVMEDEFDPAELRDEYRERVLELVEAKARGETVKVPRYRAKQPTGSLTDVLQRSLRAAREASVG